jgi:hypothetical protein
MGVVGGGPMQVGPLVQLKQRTPAEGAALALLEPVQHPVGHEGARLVQEGLEHRGDAGPVVHTSLTGRQTMIHDHGPVVPCG